MPRPSMKQFKAYLKGKPRTYGWGALLVYDRFKANRLLAHEHIENLDLGEWLPLINFEKDVDGTISKVSNLQLDRPVLSFVNSSLGLSRARLSMKVIDGLIVQLRRQAGSVEDALISYARVDPLSAPSVYMDILLSATANGNVNEEGRVTFDLSSGDNYTFKVTSWGQLNEKLGDAVKKEFGGWEDKDKVWELNVLKPVQGQLNPTSFEVRTHSLARAEQISNATLEEKEEGAVIVGVAFDGAKGGALPITDEAMPYLLPSPENEADPDYSMNLIYSNDVWLEDMLYKMVGGFASLQNLKMVRNNYGFYETLTADLKVVLPGGVDRTRRDYGGLFSVDEFKWPELTFSSTFKIQHRDEVLSIDWEGGAGPMKFVVTFIGPGGVVPMRPTGQVTARFKSGVQFNLASEPSRLGEVDISAMTTTISSEADFWDSEWAFYDDYCDIAAKDYLLPRVEAELKKFTQQFQSFAGMSIPFNLLRLNGLLFRGPDVATPRTLLLPSELSLLGDLAPRVTTFSIEPLEALIVAGVGSTQAFKLEPTMDGTVVWDVKPLKGESGEVGSIENGVYSPPAVESIEGAYKRVIVTATVSGSTSSALVTVVPNSVSVHPYLQVANFNTEAPDRPVPRYVFTGGDVDHSLSWSMVSGSKGTIRRAEESDNDLELPEDQDFRIYVSPPYSPGEKDEVEELVQLDRVQVSAGGVKQWIDVIIPWEIVSANVRATPVEAGLKLTIVNGQKELPTADTKWKVLLGTGDIDRETGIYSPGPDEGPYIIVAGRDTYGNFTTAWGYTALILSTAVKRAVDSGTQGIGEM